METPVGTTDLLGRSYRAAQTETAPGSTGLGSGLMGRTRAVRRLARWVVGRRNDELVPAALIVTSRHRLWQRYGPDGVFAIERAVGELCDAMAERGLFGTLVYTDDSPLHKCLGVLPAENGRAESVARLLQSIDERLEWTDEQARYVLLLGDDGVIPFHRLTNPSPDADEVVCSDHPYSADPEQPLVPDLAVGRIPDVGLAGLVGSITASAAAHRRLAAGERFRLPDAAFGYSASIWKRAARGVYAAIGRAAELRLSPPLTYEDCPSPGALGPRFRYYNLHGLSDSPHWFGQRDPSFPADYPFFPVAMRPDELAAAPGSVIVSEACYGAQIHDRAARDSMALSAVAGGTLAYVGATGVAYGGLDGPLVSGDLLARAYMEALLAGFPAGDALVRAKRTLIQEALERQGYLDAEDEKAILNFVLYGDPSLVHHLPSVFAEDAAGGGQALEPVERAGPVALVGTQPVRPHHIELQGAAPTQRAEAPQELLEHVRRTIARRLPEFGEADVSLSAGAAPPIVPKDPSVAGSCERVQSMVVTLRHSKPTCEGPWCNEIVRVTVDARGRIHKVTVSR